MGRDWERCIIESSEPACTVVHLDLANSQEKSIRRSRRALGCLNRARDTPTSCTNWLIGSRHSFDFLISLNPCNIAHGEGRFVSFLQDVRKCTQMLILQTLNLG